MLMKIYPSLEYRAGRWSISTEILREYPLYCLALAIKTGGDPDPLSCEDYWNDLQGRLLEVLRRQV